MKEKTELYRTDWNGVLLEILYEPLWMPAHVTGEDLAHIDAASIQRQSRCRSPRPASTPTPCRPGLSPPQAAPSPSST